MEAVGVLVCICQEGVGGNQGSVKRVWLLRAYCHALCASETQQQSTFDKTLTNAPQVLACML